MIDAIASTRLSFCDERRRNPGEDACLFFDLAVIVNSASPSPCHSFV